MQVIVALLLVLGLVQAAQAVDVEPVDNVTTVLNANGAGTTYNFAPGNYQTGVINMPLQDGDILNCTGVKNGTCTGGSPTGCCFDAQEAASSHAFFSGIAGVGDVQILKMQFHNYTERILRCTNGCDNWTFDDVRFEECGNGSTTDGNAAKIIHIEQSAGLTVTDSHFECVSGGILVQNNSTGPITVFNNVFQDHGFNAVQIGKTTSAGGQIKIQCNSMRRDGPACRSATDVEDHINLFRAQGTSELPILVQYNRIRGHEPGVSAGSGTCILMAEDGGSHQHVTDNRCICGGQVGINVAVTKDAGDNPAPDSPNYTDADNIKILDNIVVCNECWECANNGITTFFPGGAHDCDDWTITGNTIDWVQENSFCDSTPDTCNQINFYLDPNYKSPAPECTNANPSTDGAFCSVNTCNANLDEDTVWDEWSCPLSGPGPTTTTTTTTSTTISPPGTTTTTTTTTVEPTKAWLAWGDSSGRALECAPGAQNCGGGGSAAAAAILEPFGGGLCAFEANPDPHENCVRDPSPNTNDQCSCFRTYVPASITPDRLGIRLHQASGDDQLYLAIYSVDGQTQYGECQVDITGAGDGFRSCTTTSPTAMSPGDYLMCFGYDDGGTGWDMLLNNVGYVQRRALGQHGISCPSGNPPATFTPSLSQISVLPHYLYIIDE